MYGVVGSYSSSLVFDKTYHYHKNSSDKNCQLFHKCYEYSIVVYCTVKQNIVVTYRACEMFFHTIKVPSVYAVTGDYPSIAQLTVTRVFGRAHICHRDAKLTLISCH